VARIPADQVLPIDDFPRHDDAHPTEDQAPTLPEDDPDRVVVDDLRDVDR
jgi:hypothetical protein